MKSKTISQRLFLHYWKDLLDRYMEVARRGTRFVVRSEAGLPPSTKALVVRWRAQG